MIISETQENILSLLAKYKFLVISQITPLLRKSTGYVRQQLSSLSARGYIKSHKLSKTYKTEAMYYLTESGKEIIMQHSKLFDSDIKLAIGQPLFVSDFTHRRDMISLTVSIHNHLSKLDIAIVDFISYFDTQGENRKSGTLEAKTKIPLGNGFFIPDGIMLTENGAQKTIYLIEHYSDNASSRPVEQLRNKHTLCIAEGSPAKKFGIPANPFVLSAFTNDNVKNKVIEKLKSHDGFQPFAHLFFFGTLSDIMNDCGNAWKNINNEPLTFA